MSAAEVPGPLAGVRVLCVNNYLAGNYGPLLLALHGAHVVKVETSSGEAGRSSRPLLPIDGEERWSHFELRMMRGMSSVVIDLEDEAGRRDFDDLVRVTDVFWTNLRPESAGRRGVDWERLRAVNPRLVYASLTGFGLPENGRGEFDGVAAFDILIQGLAGLLGRNADPDGRPVYNGLPLADQVSSLFGAFGVLLGLRQRDATSMGCCVDVSMLDSMVAINEKAVTMFGIEHEVPEPRASATTAPFGVYRTADGWVTIAVGSDSVWSRFAEAIGPEVGRPELARDDRLRHGTGRVAHTAEVDALVNLFAAKRTTQQVIDVMLAHDVPAGPSLEVDSLLDTQHVAERGIVRFLEVPDARYPAVMSPVFISGTRQQVCPPPRLGADTDRVRRDWDISNTSVDE
jgi:formyl-CoA transferase